MSDKPFSLVKIDDLAANIRTTMARVDDVFAPSMRRQVAQIVSFYLRKKLAGHPFIHPGMKQMGKWGQCCERQARRNFTCLKKWGVIEVVAFPQGGRRASRFVVNFTGLRQLLVEMGTNPSQALFDKLREAENPDINPDMKAAENPDTCPDTMSAGIHTDREAPSKGAFAGLRLIAGGRNA